MTFYFGTGLFILRVLEWSKELFCLRSMKQDSILIRILNKIK